MTDPSRTRVVHVVVGGEVGGAERMLAGLASASAAGGARGSSGAEHTVALLSPLDDLGRMLRGAGLRVVDGGRAGEGPLHTLVRSFGRADVAWIAGVLRREAAHVVHLHTFGSQVVGTRAALRVGARVVRTEHSTRVYDDPSCWPFSRWSLARADVAVAVSQHVRNVAVRKAPWARDKLRVVPNGVDVGRFAPAGEHPAGPFAFVLVGRLEPRKGVDLALRALVEVPGVRLNVVGDGASRARLEALAAEVRVNDRVSFHGAVDDVRPFLVRAHAALGSSRSEGLGIALLEAMAMGVPVVSFAVGGVRETVIDGETGLLAREGDVAALSAAMRRAAAAPDRMRSLGEAGRRRVVEHFSLDAMCLGYGRVYDELRER
ncbi:MAG TPA: glycosyltransferase family 4 protein [Polyangiaceae bacterium]